MKRRICLLLSLLAGVLGPSARAANPCSNRGINTHLPSPSQLDAIHAAGFDWVRMDFNWKDMEPAKGQLQWGPWDTAVDHAHGLGLQVFATLAYSPKWAVADPGCQDCGSEPFANVSDWTDFVSTVVGHYKTRVKHWGLWNEPNLDHFYLGTLDQYVYDILIPGAQAVKAADPQGLVLGPELAGLGKSSQWNGDSGTCLFGACVFNGWEVDLAEVLQKGGQHIDIVTHHFYGGDAADTLAKVLDGEYDLGIKTHSSLLEIMAANAPDKEVWLTEWGWNTAPYGGYTGNGKTSEADQAAWAKEVWQKFDSGAYPQLTNLFYYDYHDGVVDGVLWAFGIRRDDGSAKPAYDTLKAWFTGDPVDCGGTGTGDPGPGDTGTGPDTGGGSSEPAPEAKPSYTAPFIEGFTDGSVDEFGPAPTVALLPPADWASIAGASPSNGVDLSATFNVAWSAGHLRVAVVVHDDAHVPNGASGMFWNGDNLQLGIDVDHDQAIGAYAADDWEIGVVQQGDVTKVECYHTPTGDCPVGAGALRVGQNTIYEVAVPIGAIAGLGNTIGLNFLINEDDGAGREGWLQWTPGIGFGKDPSRFAAVTFVGGPGDPGTTDTTGTTETPDTRDPPDPESTGATGGDTGTGAPTTDPGTGEPARTDDPASTGGDAGGVGIPFSADAGGRAPSGGDAVASGGGCAAGPAAPPSAVPSLLCVWALLALLGSSRAVRRS